MFFELPATLSALYHADSVMLPVGETLGESGTLTKSLLPSRSRLLPEPMAAGTSVEKLPPLSSVPTLPLTPSVAVEPPPSSKDHQAWSPAWASPASKLSVKTAAKTPRKIVECFNGQLLVEEFLPLLMVTACKSHAAATADGGTAITRCPASRWVIVSGRVSRPCLPAHVADRQRPTG